jgi:hypothetical protein
LLVIFICIDFIVKICFSAIWDITVVSEHGSRQLWATPMTEEGLQNITYRRRRFRSLEGRREDMEEIPRRNTNAGLRDDKEDCLIKGLTQAL